MSRTMQRRPKEKPPESSGGTPMWVGLAYVLGILAVVVLALLALISTGVFPVSANVSLPVIVLWVGVAVFAGGLFVQRRRR